MLVVAVVGDAVCAARIVVHQAKVVGRVCGCFGGAEKVGETGWKGRRACVDFGVGLFCKWINGVRGCGVNNCVCWGEL